ncbi:hypothetical protein QT381_09245 [Galbitalea sp. SE-J8]|uniref:hypothetical protein n=1 Tax=Galbitalea sp. SE-J8 TaxID=3054952 RepID=UPI00259CDFA1|nr:hypothetical protein [Galbitalea sp. SE-J8]MDM4763193.1 hypothetical protein [Galbitalea sp. SE-J8]
MAIAVAALLGAGGLLSVSTAAVADSRNIQFAANPDSLGAIPDGACTGQGPARAVTFAVSGLSGAARDVRLDGVSIAHTWISDLSVALVAPDGTAAPIFDHIGRASTSDCSNGSSSKLAGSYDFTDDAPTSISAAALAANGSTIPAGAYRAGAPDGAPAAITSAFGGSALNGTWTLSLIDSHAADVGSISAASLEIVDSTGVTITVAPSVTSQAQPTFGFYLGRSAAIECSIVVAGSAPSFSACGGPGWHRATVPLADGAYTFSVRPSYDGLLGPVTSHAFTVGAQSCASATSASRAADDAVAAATTATTSAAAAASRATAALTKAKKAVAATTKAKATASKKLSGKKRAAKVKALGKKLTAQKKTVTKRTTASTAARSALAGAQSTQLTAAISARDAAATAAGACVG